MGRWGVAGGGWEGWDGGGGGEGGWMGVGDWWWRLEEDVSRQSLQRDPTYARTQAPTHPRAHPRTHAPTHREAAQN